MIRAIAVIDGINKKSNKVMLKIDGEDTPSITEIEYFIDKRNMRRIADTRPDTAASIKKSLKGFRQSHNGKHFNVYTKVKG